MPRIEDRRLVTVSVTVNGMDSINSLCVWNIRALFGTYNSFTRSSSLKSRLFASEGTP